MTRKSTKLWLTIVSMFVALSVLCMGVFAMDPDEEIIYRKYKVEKSCKISEIMKNIPEKELWKTLNTLNNLLIGDEQNVRKSYILADYSESMFGIADDVLSRLDVKNGRMYVFAENTMGYNQNSSCWCDCIGGRTNIVGTIVSTMYEAPKDAHLYILSDLENDCQLEFDNKLCKKFEGTITLVYYVNEEEQSKVACDFVKTLQASFPNATIEIC